MSYSKEIVGNVLEELAKKRKANEANREVRLNQLYDRCPELLKIDTLLSRTGLNIFKATLQGKDGLEDRLEKERKKNDELLKSRDELLISLGLPTDYTDVKYDCPRCNDRGYVDGKVCSCLKKALIEKQLNESGIGELIKKQSFETFSLEYYPEEEREKMALLVNDLKEYVESFDTRKDNILFVGGTGLGKTHLSTSIAKEIIEKGYNVIYTTATNMFADFETDRFRDRYSDKEPISDKYLDCELLIVDDLGTEFISNFTISCLYNIINTRLNKNLPIIFNTNLNSSEIRKIYNDRITSRMFGDFEIKVFKGNDIRKIKK